MKGSIIVPVYKDKEHKTWYVNASYTNVFGNRIYIKKNFFYDLYKYNTLKCFKLSYLFLKSLKDFNIVPILRPPLIEFILHKMHKKCSKCKNTPINIIKDKFLKFYKINL